MSPSLVIGSAWLSTSGASSSTIACGALSSAISKPKSKSRKSRPSSSPLSKSISHSASSFVLLSSRRYFRFCSSVIPTFRTHSHSLYLSFFNALRRVCPAKMTLSSSITIGAQYPHCFMLSATASTAPSFFRGFLSYGTMSAIFNLIISISVPCVFWHEKSTPL